MKFSTREDINAPIEEVFKALCAFEIYERAAMRRGAEVRRRKEPEIAGLGTTWDARFVMRGKERDVTLEVVKFDQPDFMEIAMKSKAFTGAIEFELIALSRNRTRLVIGFDVRPLTLPARLLLQSLKLTKSTLDQKYRMRVSTFISVMQERLAGNIA